MIRRLSVDDSCKDGYTCPSVWADDTDPTHVIVVGEVVPAGVVPTADHEIAVRVKRQVITDADIA